METLIPPLSTAIVLSIVVGLFHTGLYLVIRNSAGKHLPLVLAAAMVGAYVGNAVGRRAGDAVHLGDYSLSWASIVAWVCMLAVLAVASIRPDRGSQAEMRRDRPVTPEVRTGEATGPGTGTGTSTGTEVMPPRR